jgi:putative NADH-flavin reductase
MKVVVFGAAGKIGSRIVTELLSHGHKVTAVVRDKSKLNRKERNLNVVEGDALDSNKIKQLSRGCNTVVSAIGPSKPEDSVRNVVDAAESFVKGLADIRDVRLFVLGGAGSLEVTPGVLLMDTPEFPEAWKQVALAHKDALEIYKKSPLIWTYLSPAAMLEPGPRKGSYRQGLDALLTDAKGQSKISMEDLALAVVDELENPKHRRMRFTVAW